MDSLNNGEGACMSEPLTADAMLQGRVSLRTGQTGGMGEYQDEWREKRRKDREVWLFILVRDPTESYTGR